MQAYVVLSSVRQQQKHSDIGQYRLPVTELDSQMLFGNGHWDTAWLLKVYSNVNETVQYYLYLGLKVLSKMKIMRGEGWEGGNMRTIMILDVC